MREFFVGGAAGTAGCALAVAITEQMTKTEYAMLNLIGAILILGIGLVIGKE